MKRTKQHTTYETHFKHKLNMLEPGIALVALDIAFLLMPIKIIAFGLAGLTLLVLLLLLIIEAHHDNVLNEIAAQQRR